MSDKRSSRSLRPSPPVPTETVFSFTSDSAKNDGFHNSDDRPETDLLQINSFEPYHLAEMLIEGPDAVEIGDLLKLSIHSPQPLDAQMQARWGILNDSSITPSHMDNASAEFPILDTDTDQLIVAANLLFPNGTNHQLIKPVIVSGTNLPSLIRSFQQVVAQAQFSPRLTKRLADSLFKARQAQAQGLADRLSLHLHSFVRDCSQILKKKKRSEDVV